MGADDIESFLHASSFCDDVFDDENALAGSDFKSASQNQFALLFFDEDEPAAELSGDFLSKDQPAHGGGDDGLGVERADWLGEGGAELLDDGHLLQGEGALKILAAMESASEDEMALEERAGFAEDAQHFVFGHGRDSKRRVRTAKQEVEFVSRVLTKRGHQGWSGCAS
jgi:hypothetical protein